MGGQRGRGEGAPPSPPPPPGAAAASSWCSAPRRGWKIKGIKEAVGAKRGRGGHGQGVPARCFVRCHRLCPRRELGALLSPPNPTKTGFLGEKPPKTTRINLPPCGATPTLGAVSPPPHLGVPNPRWGADLYIIYYRNIQFLYTRLAAGLVRNGGGPTPACPQRVPVVPRPCPRSVAAPVCLGPG